MEELLFAISKRSVLGHLPLIKFGRLPSTTGGGYEDVWPAAGTRTYLTTASTIRVKAGGNTADTAAGTGARAVVIEGLDADYNAVTDTLVTAGASASAASANTYLRVDRAYVTDVGTGGANTAAITLEAVTGGSTQNIIGAGEGQTQLAAFTVPRGYAAYIVGRSVSLADTKGAATTQHVAQVRIQKRLYSATSTNSLESWRTFYDEGLDTDGTGASQEMSLLADPLPEKTDVRMQVYSHIAAAQVTGRLYVILVSQ